MAQCSSVSRRRSRASFTAIVPSFHRSPATRRHGAAHASQPCTVQMVDAFKGERGSVNDGGIKLIDDRWSTGGLPSSQSPTWNFITGETCRLTSQVFQATFHALCNSTWSNFSSPLAEQRTLTEGQGKNERLDRSSENQGTRR